MTIGDWAKSLVDSLPWGQKKNDGVRKTGAPTIDPEAFLRQRDPSVSDMSDEQFHGVVGAALADSDTEETRAEAKAWLNRGASHPRAE